MVQRFVDASILGWQRYLAGEDTAAADALIKKENPAMTDGQIAYSRRKMRELELLGPSDNRDGSNAAVTGRIGAIDVARVRDFYKKMVAAGMYKADDIRREEAVTVEFVND
jgi:NitT/TauT family transport system substrate-binding protein